MKYGLILLFLPFLWACQRHYPVTADSSFTDTWWTYQDKETEYDIHFLDDGTMAHSREGDTSPGNDFWYEKNGVLYFSMNDNHAHYTGTLVDSGWVAGTARNRKGVKWEWQMRAMQFIEE